MARDLVDEQTESFRRMRGLVHHLSEWTLATLETTNAKLIEHSSYEHVRQTLRQTGILQYLEPEARVTSELQTYAQMLGVSAEDALRWIHMQLGVRQADGETTVQNLSGSRSRMGESEPAQSQPV